MELTYASYLRLDDLLDLQEQRSEPAEHDELLFIVVHQASELWLKQLLAELDKIGGDLSDNHLFRVISSFRRANRIVRVLIDQLDVLETMTPLSFHRFRDRLDTSSGFQSMQFRQLEFLLGLKRADILDHYPVDLAGRDDAERRLREPSIPDHFYDFLEQRGVEIPVDVRARDVTRPNVADERVQAGLFDLYRFDGSYTMLFEVMIDLDAALQEWRYRHIKIVERTIGDKMGTGGSLGVEFLKRSLFSRAFPDLWAIRARF
ncbi:MAG: tryptophan 2,3-dioxygenase family protein [Acidimicrobiia bacterium]|nr:tryptophan 2,3-dioxygenase family protein [Acidimicrobiia bacterium]